MSNPRQIFSEEIFKCPWWRLKHDRYRLNNDSEKLGDYYYIETGGSAFIVPVLDDGRIILLKQYRYLVDREVIELPGGGIKAGQDPKQAASHELEEETGYIAASLEHIGEFIPFDGISNEICQVFLARDMRKTEQRLEDSEEIKTIVVSLGELAQMIEENKIQDGMTLAALRMAQKYLVKK